MELTQDLPIFKKNAVEKYSSNSNKYKYCKTESRGSVNRCEAVLNGAVVLLSSLRPITAVKLIT